MSIHYPDNPNIHPCKCSRCGSDFYGPRGTPACLACVGAETRALRSEVRCLKAALRIADDLLSHAAAVKWAMTGDYAAAGAWENTAAGYLSARTLSARKPRKERTR